jgi:hypothetical protein
MNARGLVVLLAVAALIAALPGVVAAHEGSAKQAVLDHDPPGFDPDPIDEPSGEFQSGGEGAEWENVGTIFTGNPHTDLDFFMQNGEIYLSTGTLAFGGNRGGQTIVQVTQDGEVDPVLVSSIPTAGCVVDYSGALGLQHDIQAYPKGDIPLHTDFGARQDRRDAQILVDATDSTGRCHDQGPVFGAAQAPQGGLEIIDITDIENPVEIALTSHIGEAHTVTVDPTRPIAYAASSDAVAIRTGDDGEQYRANEDADDQPLRLDGFEVVDLSSCIDFPADATIEERRGIVDDAFADDGGCRPEVYRYRFEMDWARGTFDHDWTGACHDLEVYPNDLLVCAALNATIILDMSGAFDESGRPRGTPLDCQVRESSNAGPTEPWRTDAPIIDCVEGEDPATGEAKDLRIPAWIEDGAPSLDGVELVGFVNHGGRDGTPPAHHPSEDIEVAHEVEFSTSGDFIIVSDERGGAVVPPGATCVPDEEWPGNGGLHAFRVDQLYTEYPAVLDNEGSVDSEATAERARQAYALTPDGEPAIYRAEIRVPAATVCTAHVFRHIPGQNRIFMAWYTQGTQVVDYIEHPDGTFEFMEAGYYIPLNANQWVSHVFKWEDNDDGTFTYWGVAADFQLGAYGRNALDFYKVTLPAPPEPAAPAPDPEPEPEDEAAPPEALPATGGGPAYLAALLILLAAALTTAVRLSGGRGRVT